LFQATVLSFVTEMVTDPSVRRASPVSVWGSLTSLAAGALGKACYGDRWGKRIALLHAAASVVANDADINYSF
jgi:hypothetical protein